MKCECKWCKVEKPVLAEEKPSAQRARAEEKADGRRQRLGEMVQKALRAEYWLPGGHRFVKLWHDGGRWWDERPWLKQVGTPDEEGCVQMMEAGGVLALMPEKHRTWLVWLDPVKIAEYERMEQEFRETEQALQDG